MEAFRSETLGHLQKIEDEISDEIDLFNHLTKAQLEIYTSIVKEYSLIAKIKPSELRYTVQTRLKSMREPYIKWQELEIRKLQGFEKIRNTAQQMHDNEKTISADVLESVDDAELQQKNMMDKQNLCVDLLDKLILAYQNNRLQNNARFMTDGKFDYKKEYQYVLTALRKAMNYTVRIFKFEKKKFHELNKLMKTEFRKIKKLENTGTGWFNG